jgi:hypothetical protein
VPFGEFGEVARDERIARSDAVHDGDKHGRNPGSHAIDTGGRIGGAVGQDNVLIPSARELCRGSSSPTRPYQTLRTPARATAIATLASAPPVAIVACAVCHSGCAAEVRKLARASPVVTILSIMNARFSGKAVRGEQSRQSRRRRSARAARSSGC